MAARRLVVLQVALAAGVTAVAAKPAAAASTPRRDSAFRTIS